MEGEGLEDVMRLSILYSGGRGIGGCDDSTVEGEGLEDVMRLFSLLVGETAVRPMLVYQL